MLNISLFVGEFAATGWLAYPPLSGIEYSPWVGVDYWLWSLQISGIGTLLTGVNFVVTIIRMRAPGMKLMQMPVFTWTALTANVLIILAFPILTVTIALLTLDRYRPTSWLLPRAQQLFDQALEIAWDREHGGLCYGFSPAHAV